MKLNKNYRLFDVAGQSLLLYTGGKSVDVNAAFALNETAAWLVKKAGDQEFTEPMLVDWLLEEFEVEEEQAQADVKTLVELLIKQTIIEE